MNEASKIIVNCTDGIDRTGAGDEVLMCRCELFTPVRDTSSVVLVDVINTRTKIESE